MCLIVVVLDMVVVVFVVVGFVAFLTSIASSILSGSHLTEEALQYLSQAATQLTKLDCVLQAYLVVVVVVVIVVVFVVVVVMVRMAYIHI